MLFIFIYKLPSRYVMLSYRRFSNRCSKDLTVHRSFEHFIATRFHQKTAIVQTHFSVLQPHSRGIEKQWRLHWTGNIFSSAEFVFSNWKPVDLVWFYSRKRLCKYTMTISNQRHRLFKVGSTFRSARSNPSSVDDNMAPFLYLSTADGYGKVPAPLSQAKSPESAIPLVAQLWRAQNPRRPHWCQG